jgi:hypothetical protein
MSTAQNSQQLKNQFFLNYLVVLFIAISFNNIAINLKMGCT